ncbi:MAG: sugar ABC transporter ATP-binding protein [Sphaerochaeta sp.]
MIDSILRISEITKLFPGVRALDKVDFNLRAGEVHILVGENGAGKSTLAKVLLGVYQPDHGDIFLDEKKISFHTPEDAINVGIVAVYQEFTLIPYLSVAENIFIGREYKNRLGFVDHKRMQKESRELLHSLNSDYIDVTSPVKTLSVAEQQMVEISKALSFKPKIIVFDEPTATLSDVEVKSLFIQIHKLKAAGIGIIYVSHRMEEFKEIGDRITVLRDGQKIATVGIEEFSQVDLVNMMVGRDISQVYKRTANDCCGEALRVEHLADYSGKVKDFSFHVNKGEIVGLAGLIGSGRTETAQLIFGIRKIKQGNVYVNGKEVEPSSPKQMIKQSIGLVPEDRKRQGLALNDIVAWNIVGVSLRKIFPRFFVDYKKVEVIAEKYREDLRIATPDIKKACKQLSGGNQQKVVLAKWLVENPDIFIFDEPTRGIDVGAKMEIYAMLDNLAKQGKAILMISSEMAEVIGMSDRIYIIRDGQVVGESIRGAADFSVEEIGTKMLLGERK